MIRYVTVEKTNLGHNPQSSEKLIELSSRQTLLNNRAADRVMGRNSILYTKVEKFMIIARAPRLEPEARRGL
jgi:hypothetical protein